MKALSGRGTPLRGGWPSGHAAVAFAGWMAITLMLDGSEHRFLVSSLAFIMALLVAQTRSRPASTRRSRSSPAVRSVPSWRSSSSRCSPHDRRRAPRARGRDRGAGVCAVLGVPRRLRRAHARRKVIEGVNVENAAYPLGVCAERTTFSRAIVEGYRPGDFERRGDHRLAVRRLQAVARRDAGRARRLPERRTRRAR